MGLIHEKNQGPKISCYCTFKPETALLSLPFLPRMSFYKHSSCTRREQEGTLDTVNVYFDSQE
jgi:hypothetical protein